MRVEIPGLRTLQLEYLVLDLNGTVTLDGEILSGVAERLAALSAGLTVHLVTADTRGRAAEIGEGLGIRLLRIRPNDEAGQKRALVERLGAERTVAMGPTTPECWLRLPWGSPSWGQKGWPLWHCTRQT
jgi:soluble P-type ATPase